MKKMQHLFLFYPNSNQLSGTNLSQIMPLVSFQTPFTPRGIGGIERDQWHEIV